MAGTMGSHSGSFAGGFIKSFLAVMQMAMRKRQMDTMSMFYKKMMDKMDFDMQTQRGVLGLAQTGRDASKGNLTNFDYKEGGSSPTGKVSIPDMEKMAAKAGFKGDEIPHIAAIASAESGGNPDAKGKAGEIGLTQINPVNGRELADSAHDPQGAFNAAFKIYKQQGWGAWSTDPTSKNFTPNNSMEKFYGTAKKAYASEPPKDDTTKTATEPDVKTIVPAKTAAPATTPPIPDRTVGATQPFQPYQVAEAGDQVQPPPTATTAPTSATAPPIAPRSGADITAPLAGGATDPRLASTPTTAPAAAAAAAPTQPPAAIPPRGLQPGLVQSTAGGVRGQQPGQGPIYTAGQFGQPAAPAAPATTATTGVTKYPITAPPISVGGGGQNTPLAATPLPPTRPTDLGALPDTGSGTGPGAGSSSMNVAGGGTGDPMWYGYSGASPDQAASADPLDNMYTMNQAGAASAGLTDTSGLMAAGMMANAAMADDTDATANMYKGGPVVRYYRGGVIKRYDDGGDVDSQPEPSPSTAGGPPMDPSDRDVMIKTIAGEAGGEPPLGQAAVAHTILNRVADGGYGDGIQGVAKAPVKPGSQYHQFSVWNAPGMPDHSKITHSITPDNPLYSSIGSVVDKAYNGTIPDPTNGATHYYAPQSMPGGKAPSWAADLAKQNQVKIGGNVFVGRSQGPGQTAPTQMAGYRRGGVINRYASGGDTDEDLLGEYGGTDTDDPMGNVYWDQQRMANLTNDSEAAPDLTTSIQNRAALTPQDEEAIKPQPGSLDLPSVAPPPSDQPAAAPTDQPAAPPSEEPIPPQPTAQSDIPPGSVQVAGPGGWGSAGRDLTNISMPRVGGSMGMGGMGMGMRRPSISSAMGGSRATSIIGGKGQPLYIPGYIANHDFDAKGLAPVSNADGSPSVWLMNMVDNGVRTLFSGFGLGGQGAIPGSQGATQSRDAFASNDSPSMLDRDDMHSLGRLNPVHDEKGDFIESASEIGGAVSMIKYYALTGNLDAASRLAGGVLLYTRMMSMEQGDAAVNSLFKGDMKNAVKYIQDGYNWVPDAKTVKGEIVDEKKGVVRATQKDGSGNTIAEQDYLPAAIMKAALGLKDGTGYWNMLSGLARSGGNDALGAHYQTQQLLRGIQGNENEPPPPIADGIGKTLPVTSPPTTPTTPTAPDTTTAPPEQATAPAPDTSQPSVTPPISPRDAGGAPSGQASLQPTQQPGQPPQAIPDRGDASNLVAGPGAPSTTQPTVAPPAGGSGATLVAQQQARDQVADQQPAISRMLKEGQYDPDDPYVQQKITQINSKYFDGLRPYYKQFEQQYADIEGADISSADKKSLKVALDMKVKDFNEQYRKPRETMAKQEFAGVQTKLKEQFQVQMTAEKQAQAERVARQKEVYDTEKGTVASQMKDLEPRNMNDEQIRLLGGVDAQGKPLVDGQGNRIRGYDGDLETPFGIKGADGTSVVNPLEQAAQSKPFLSGSYNGKPGSFDIHNIKDPDGQDLFNSPKRKTMYSSAEDMIKYDKSVGAVDAKDFVTGLATGNYTITDMRPHVMPRSPILTNKDASDLVDENNRVRSPDGVERYDVTISRGGNDIGTRVIMSKNMAAKLGGINADAIATANYNQHKQIISNVPPTRNPAPPIPRGPSNASKSDVQTPPPAAPDTPLPPRQTPTPLTPNALPQTNYDIPPDTPTIADWIRQHTTHQQYQSPFR